MAEGALYPNAPIQEAVFEIRFPAEPAIECHRDEFYELIRSDYGVVHVPKVKSGDAPALEFYKFSRADDSATVMVTLNRVAYSVKRYEGFQVFKKEASRLIGLFGKTFRIGSLKRTGLRYIDMIDVVRDGAEMPIANFLNVGVRLPENFPGHVMQFEVAVVSQTPGGSVTTRIQPVRSEDQKKEAILLDFDYAKEGDGLSITKLDEYLEESHRHTKEMFEQLITPSYRQYLKGETV